MSKSLLNPIIAEHEALPDQHPLLHIVEGLDFVAPGEDELTWLLWGKAPGQVTLEDLESK